MESDDARVAAELLWEDAKTTLRKMHGTDDPALVLHLVRQRPGVRRKVFREVERLCEQERRSFN